MQPKYEHTQKAGLPFYACLCSAAISIFIILLCGTANNLAAILILVVPLWAVVLIMMSSLTVTIDESCIHIRFGLGIFRKKFYLSDVAGCGNKYKTYVWGWGIRWYVRGWLYNIAGFDSVEIILKNGKKARIGTDEPELLAAAIRQATGNAG